KRSHLRQTNLDLCFDCRHEGNGLALFSACCLVSHEALRDCPVESFPYLSGSTSSLSLLCTKAWHDHAACQGVKLALSTGGGRSGRGMNSWSPGTVSKRPARQSAFAWSIRSFREETKFHQIKRGPSIGSPPSIRKRASERARMVMRSPGRNT